jgi:hypothetical protein
MPCRYERVRELRGTGLDHRFGRAPHNRLCARVQYARAVSVACTNGVPTAWS